MKQHLIISANPNPKSFSQGIVDVVNEHSLKRKWVVTHRNLYQMEFNPTLSQKELQSSFQGITPSEILHEQSLIKEADYITIICPLWWMGFPAILKGYLDRVLTYNFAYSTDEQGNSIGLLAGKRIQLIISVGNQLEEYEKLGFLTAFKHTLADGLFNFCGITDVKSEYIGNIHRLSKEELQQVLNNLGHLTEENLASAE